MEVVVRVAAGVVAARPVVPRAAEKAAVEMWRCRQVPPRGGSRRPRPSLPLPIPRISRSP